MGGRALSGRLPVTANRIYREGDGVNTVKDKVGLGSPTEVGLNPQVLAAIDSITLDAIEAKATLANCAGYCGERWHDRLREELRSSDLCGK